MEYDGTNLAGWQRQENAPSVQEFLEKAVKGFAGVEVTVAAAGRTDAGVHALGQVAHIDLPREYPLHQVRDGLNFHLARPDIAVLQAQAVAPDFHARFSAKSREYLYRIICRKAPLVLDRERIWRIPYELDVKAMHDAAQILLGQHDFSSFRAAACQAQSPIKTLDILEVYASGAEIHVRAKAKSFLHHQVRNMVGSLKLVGEGKWDKADLDQALNAKDRRKGGPTAPASGLYFVGVEY